MATLAEIMDALADQIRDELDDVPGVAVQVEPRWVANPTAPCIDMYPTPEPSVDQELRAFGETLGAELLTVRARIDPGDTTATQDLLLAFMDDEDPLSLAGAIMSDPTIGGLAAVDVRSRSGYTRSVEGGEHIGCLWQLVIVKARS